MSTAIAPRCSESCNPCREDAVATGDGRLGHKSILSSTMHEDTVNKQFPVIILHDSVSSVVNVIQ